MLIHPVYFRMPLIDPGCEVFGLTLRCWHSVSTVRYRRSSSKLSVFPHNYNNLFFLLAQEFRDCFFTKKIKENSLHKWSYCFHVLTCLGGGFRGRLITKISSLCHQFLHFDLKIHETCSWNDTSLFLIFKRRTVVFFFSASRVLPCVTRLFLHFFFMQILHARRVV